MGIISSLRSSVDKVLSLSISPFAFPVEKQREYLTSISEPIDDIERAYDQYRCQLKFFNPVLNAAMQLASLPAILLYLVKASDPVLNTAVCDAIFFSDGKPENIIPDELKTRFNRIETIDVKRKNLSRSDKAFFKGIVKRYPFSWQFLLKNLIKISYYSYEIHRSNPKAIIVCNEYSFTSSILTAYCTAMGIEHINVMHGEKLFFMRDSFFHFDRCYVWNEFYRDLFCELRAQKSQFQVSVPPSMRFSTSNAVEKEYDYTFYLGAERDEQLQQIIFCLNLLKQRGKKVSLRPHPRYSDLNMVRRFCIDGITIEDGGSLPIEMSILRTRNAVSGFSTVLNQAYHNGVKIVIDDVSKPEAYKKLEELGYVMLKVEHKLLSQVLEES